MTFLIANVSGLIGAAIGWVAGTIAAPLASPWLGAIDIPFAGPALDYIDSPSIGAGLGLIVGTLLALRFHGGYRAAGALFGRGILAGIVSGSFIIGSAMAGGPLFDAIGLNPLAPTLEFEIRLPPGSSPPSAHDDIQIELHTDRNQILANLREIAREGDRPVLRATAPLVFRTAQRTIVMSLAGEPVRVFRLRIPARPTPSPEYGPWQQVDFMEDAAQQVRRADVTADYLLRYRIN
jgi:hypothetical protein